MKRSLPAFAVVGASALVLAYAAPTKPARAQAAVVCVNCTQDLSQWVQFGQTMAQWASQLSYMLQQYNQLVTFYNAANHITSSNFATVLTSPLVENPLASAPAFMNSLLGIGSPTGNAMGYIQSWQWYQPQQTTDFAAIEIQRREQGAGTIADQAQNGLAAAVQHLNGIRQLRDQIDLQGTSADQTAVNARIAEEQAALNNLQHQASNLQLLISQQSQVAEVRSLEKQRQDSECMMSATAADAQALGISSFGGGTGVAGNCGAGVGSAISGVGSGTVPTGGTTGGDGGVVLAGTNADPGTNTSLTSFSGDLASNPLGSQIAANAQSLGVNPAAVEAACTAESQCANGAASGTGATGPMQVINGTYDQTRSEIAVTNPDIAAQMTGNTDPLSNYAAGTQYLKDAATNLQNAGVADPNGVDGRGYYEFGPAYGATLATAPDTATMGSIVTNSNSLAVNNIPQSETVGAWRANTATALGPKAYAPILLQNQQTASN